MVDALSFVKSTTTPHRLVSLERVTRERYEVNRQVPLHPEVTYLAQLHQGMDWSEKSVKSFPTTFVEPETEDDDACSLVRNDLPFCGRNRMLQD